MCHIFVNVGSIYRACIFFGHSYLINILKGDLTSPKQLSSCISLKKLRRRCLNAPELIVFWLKIGSEISKLINT
jgi:hypothetical protein